MSIRIFTIAFDPDKKLFHDEDLSTFLLNKYVKKLYPEFFQINDRAFWTVFVEYETIVKSEKPNSNGLNEAENLLMKRLKEWRKEKADKEGIPVFIIATNKQLVDVIKRRPVSQEALREIHGFGKKKIERYGAEIVKIITAFYEKKPLRSGKSKKITDQKSKTDHETDKKSS
ncbi:MAG: HRDC domain-containing protein [Deltaproteobacteria bacterium]|nr:HRDC domain-containing protein [Deltaproteobacteria bacterium]